MYCRDKSWALILSSGHSNEISLALLLHSNVYFLHTTIKFFYLTWILIKIILGNDRVDLLMPALPELNLCKLQISILWCRSPHIQIWGIQSNFFYRPNVLRWSSIQMKICSRVKKLALRSSSSRPRARSPWKRVPGKNRFFKHFAAFALSKSLRHKEQLTLRALS